MKKLASALVLLILGIVAAQTTVTIGSVNNPDMVTMQELSSQFEADNPDIKLEWLFLDEGTLRSRITTDVATSGGSFDLVTVGAYETPLWAANGWISSIDKLSQEYPDDVANYNFDDILPAIRAGISYNDELFAVPFYGESSFTMYNKRLLDAAGVTMPENPTWQEVRDIACKVNDPANGVYGIVLRGKPGWGDNMAPITTVVNTFGGQWFDAEGHPTIDTPEWKEAITFYKDLVTECGAPGVTGISFPEALQLMSSGQAAIWVDATVAAGFLAGSEAGPDMAYALAPHGPVDKGNAWLWSLELGDSQLERRPRSGVQVPHLGHLERLHQPRRREKRLGRRAPRHARLDLRKPRLLGGGSLRAHRPRCDSESRPDRFDRQSTNRPRRPVRADSRIPGHRQRCCANRRGDSRGRHQRRRRLGARPTGRRPSDAGRGLLLSLHFEVEVNLYLEFC